MSKKATRRAARQAFPKAKTPPPPRSNYGSRPRRPATAKSSGTSRGLARPGNKPPSIKRAVTWAFIMAFIYFVLIEWGWKSGATTLGNFIIAAIGFVLFSAVVYLVDWFKFRRYQNKQRGSLK
ncbi:MAG: hypothetical protein JXA87_12080 [Thermoleophilia bacterium]|nr:hypothetical protein [Thermoleophilia bacterium]